MRNGKNKKGLVDKRPCSRGPQGSPERVCASSLPSPTALRTTVQSHLTTVPGLLAYSVLFPSDTPCVLLFVSSRWIIRSKRAAASFFFPKDFFFFPQCCLHVC